MPKRTKPVTLTRTVGTNGRFVIPQDLRKMFKIEDGKKVMITLSDNGIYIRPFEENQENAN